jgi:class 3 adenylate cyclase
MERNPSSEDPRASAEACERIRRYLEQGAPWDACDAFRESIEQHAGDAELLYWGALAHARSGAASAAHAILDRAQAASPPPERLTDILSLRGRLWKDAYHRAPGKVGARALAEHARSEYLAAYAVSRDPFPGINAATLSWILGDRAESQRLAREVAAGLARQAAPRNFWDVATEGEARTLLGEFERARDAYAAAYREASGDAGSVATMRRQVALLARSLPEARPMLLELPVPDVIAFAGHMIDAPGRRAPRFPASLEPLVQAAVRERLLGFHRPIVYTSAACGADLIFIEAALDRGAEVNIVLPFARADFERTSVAIGGEGWTQRCDAALKRASRVFMATEEGHLDDDVLFEHAAVLLEGLAVLRASQLETTPMMLCVLDPVADGRLGGTHSSFDRWKRNVAMPQTIDLRELRYRVGPSANAVGSGPAASAASRGSVTVGPAGARGPAARPQRTIKTLVFADFVGSSRLDDALAPFFQEGFWKIAAGEIEAARTKPLLASTWGDALYVVFDSPRDGAEFALSFLQRIEGADWRAVGLPESSRVRIALHAGPVFRGFDPIMARDNYFGSSVTKAARIEPVTPPGMVYASEAFAATLTAMGAESVAIEYVGRLPLAKGYGESRIYRLERR